MSDRNRVMEKYGDIIDLPVPTSTRHARMSIESRAAQFSPFAALTGHDDAIREVGRLTERRIELDESAKAALNARLELALDNIDTPVEITYFVPDGRKQGGSYRTAIVTLDRFDEYERVVVLSDGTRIPIDDVYGIEQA